MKWKFVLQLSLFFFIGGILNAGSTKKQTILGVSYDSCTIYLLKSPKEAPYSVFDKKKKLKSDVISLAIPLGKREATNVASVLNQHKKMGEDTCDCRCVPFVIVFHRDKKPILQVFPNVPDLCIWGIPYLRGDARYIENRLSLECIFRERML